MKKNLFIFTCISIFIFCFSLFSSSEQKLANLAGSLESIRKVLPEKPSIPKEKSLKWKKEWDDKPWYWDVIILEDNKDNLVDEGEAQNLVNEKDSILKEETSPKKIAIVARLKQLLTAIMDLETQNSPAWENVTGYIQELLDSE